MYLYLYNIFFKIQQDSLPVKVQNGLITDLSEGKLISLY